MNTTLTGSHHHLLSVEMDQLIYVMSIIGSAAFGAIIGFALYLGTKQIVKGLIRLWKS